VNFPETRLISTNRLDVTKVGVGGAPIGNEFTDEENDEAVATVMHAYDMGIRHFDTAPIYGLGRSERRIGQALAGVPRDEITVSTKVGRLLVSATGKAKSSEVEIVFDWSRDGVLRFLEESLERLGMDRIDIALLHGSPELLRTGHERSVPNACRATLARGSESHWGWNERMANARTVCSRRRLRLFPSGRPIHAVRPISPCGTAAVM